MRIMCLTCHLSFMQLLTFLSCEFLTRMYEWDESSQIKIKMKWCMCYMLIVSFQRKGLYFLLRSWLPLISWKSLTQLKLLSMSDHFKIKSHCGFLWEDTSFTYLFFTMKEPQKFINDSLTQALLLNSLFEVASLPNCKWTEKYRDNIVKPRVIWGEHDGIQWNLVNHC